MSPSIELLDGKNITVSGMSRLEAERFFDTDVSGISLEGTFVLIIADRVKGKTVAIDFTKGSFMDWLGETVLLQPEIDLLIERGVQEVQAHVKDILAQVGETS